MSERKEAWMRFLVLIVSGIIIGLWRGLIQFISFFHWFFVLFTGKRSKDLAVFCEIWNTQAYVFLRYINFVTNERPFPFNNIKKSISEFKK